METLFKTLVLIAFFSAPHALAQMNGTAASTAGTAGAAGTTTGNSGALGAANGTSGTTGTMGSTVTYPGSLQAPTTTNQPGFNQSPTMTGLPQPAVNSAPTAAYPGTGYPSTLATPSATPGYGSSGLAPSATPAVNVTPF
jgi:hypothetical protein